MVNQQRRPVVRITAGQEGMEGAGVRIRRLIMTPDVEMIDPFLMLDWFHSDSPSDYLAGFPDHPHRGFETVTYMLAGRMRHKDNKGNEGVIGPGDIQWMTAGGGIVHSEMPEQIDGLMSGFQLWVNLPAAQKMRPATYQDVAAERIPTDMRPESGAAARVITGTTSRGVTGPIADISTDPIYLDVQLEAGGAFEEPVDNSRQGFVVVHSGSVTIDDGGDGAVLTTGQLAVLGDGDLVRLTAGSGPGKALLVAGRPINEPVVRGGPFVMNSRAEVLQAFDDFHNGRM